MKDDEGDTNTEKQIETAVPLREDPPSHGSSPHTKGINKRSQKIGAGLCTRPSLSRNVAWVYTSARSDLYMMAREACNRKTLVVVYYKEVCIHRRKKPIIAQDVYSPKPYTEP